MRIQWTWRFLILVWLWAPQNSDSFSVLSPASLSLLVSPFSAPIKFARPLTSLMTLNALTTARTGLLIAYKKAQKRVKPFNYYEKSNIVGQPTIENFNINRLRREYDEQEADQGLGIKLNVQFTHPLLEKAKQIQRKFNPKPKKRIKFRPLDSYPLWIQDQIKPNKDSWTGLGIDPAKIEHQFPLSRPTSTTIEIETVPQPYHPGNGPPKEATIEIISTPIRPNYPHIPPPPKPIPLPSNHETSDSNPSNKPQNIQDILRPVRLPPRPIPPPPKPIGYLEGNPSAPGPIHNDWLNRGKPLPPSPPQMPLFEFPHQHFPQPPFIPDIQLLNKNPLTGHDKYLMSVRNVMNNKDSFLKALPWRQTEAHTHDHVKVVSDRPERDVLVLPGMNGGFETAEATRVEVHQTPNGIPSNLYKFNHGPIRHAEILPTPVELHQGPIRHNQIPASSFQGHHGPLGPREISDSHLPRSVGSGGTFVQLTHPSEVPELRQPGRKPNSVKPEYGGFRPIHGSNGLMEGPNGSILFQQHVQDNGKDHIFVQHTSDGQVHHFLPASQLANIHETNILPRDKYFDLLRRNVTEYKHAILIPVRNYDHHVEESKKRLNFTLFRPKNVVSQRPVNVVTSSKPRGPSIVSEKLKTSGQSKNPNNAGAKIEPPQIITKDTVTFGHLNHKNAVILTKVKAPNMVIVPSRIVLEKPVIVYPPVIGTQVSEINLKNTSNTNRQVYQTSTRQVGHSQALKNNQAALVETLNGQKDLASAQINKVVDPALFNHNFHSQRIVPHNQPIKTSNSYNPDSQRINAQVTSNQNHNFNPTNHERVPSNQNHNLNPTNYEQVPSNQNQNFNPTNHERVPWNQNQNYNPTNHDQVPSNQNHNFNSQRNKPKIEPIKTSSSDFVFQQPRPTNHQKENFNKQRLVPEQESIQLSHLIQVDNKPTTSNSGNTTTNMTYIEWLQKYYPDYYNKYFHNTPAKALIQQESNYGKSNNAYLDWLNKYFPNWRNVSYANQNTTYYDWLKTYYPAYYQKHYAAKLELDKQINSNRQAVSASEPYASYHDAPSATDYTAPVKKPDWTVDVSLKRPRTDNPFSLFESRDPFSSLLFGDKYKVPYPSPPSINVRDYLAERVRQNRGKAIKASIQVTTNEPEDHALKNVVNYADYILKRADSPQCLLHLVCHVDELIHQQVVKKRQLDLYQRRYTSLSDEDNTWRRRHRIKSHLLNGRNDDVRCDDSSRSQREGCQRLSSEEEVLAKMIEIAFPA